MLAIAGNLSRYFQMREAFTYNYDFIPIAATVLYSMALGLPAALKLLMRFIGVDLFNGTFIEVSRSLISVDIVSVIVSGHLRLLLYLLCANLFRMRLPRPKPPMGLHRLFSPRLCRLPPAHPLARPRQRGRATRTN